ncbi:hypothetical protein [Lentilactobacillus kefiri]|uniref:hypothetical protein n=1 Tax=Lentilactobacillus kefiri TaxID=33962 RepID=UPI0013A548EE|nr:hypothetical protein [Lentilactobacillus kefiri]
MSKKAEVIINMVLAFLTAMIVAAIIGSNHSMLLIYTMAIFNYLIFHDIDAASSKVVEK